MNPQVSPHEILASVSQFYNDAFSNLLVVVGIILGFAGVVFPIGIAILQSRQQKKEGELNREKLEIEISSAIKEIENKLKEDQAKSLDAFSERSDKLLEELRKDVQKKLWLVEAGTFHVQATSSTVNLVRARSSSDAVKLYCMGEDFMNLRRAGKILIGALKKLNKEDLKKRAELVESCKANATLLRKADCNGALDDLVDEIESALNDALEREAIQIEPEKDSG